MSYEPGTNFPTPYDIYASTGGDCQDEESVADVCVCCGADIFVGEEYYDIDGEAYCEECVRGMKKEAEL